MVFVVTSYPLADVLRITGATKAQIVHWHGRGLIKPTQESEGTGHKRLFDAQELVAIRGAVVLVNDFHLPLRALRVALEGIRTAARRLESTVTITARDNSAEIVIDVNLLAVTVREVSGTGEPGGISKFEG